MRGDENSTFKMANYMFRRISDTEFIEILLQQNSSLEYKIHYGNSYTFNTELATIFETKFIYSLCYI
ncbi:MAG: hypothetical protein RSD40_01440, partial [Bacilli bacterium]